MRSTSLHPRYAKEVYRHTACLTSQRRVRTLSMTLMTISKMCGRLQTTTSPVSLTTIIVNLSQRAPLEMTRKPQWLDKSQGTTHLSWVGLRCHALQDLPSSAHSARSSHPQKVSLERWEMHPGRTEPIQSWREGWSLDLTLTGTQSTLDQSLASKERRTQMKMSCPIPSSRRQLSQVSRRAILTLPHMCKLRVWGPTHPHLIFQWVRF